jgi:hypothetical protein
MYAAKGQARALADGPVRTPSKNIAYTSWSRWRWASPDSRGMGRW